MLTMWDWIVSRIVTRPAPFRAPPVHPPRPVALTTPEERAKIDHRLQTANRRLAELQALAGLDGLRSHYGDKQRDD